jgi:NTP pyrophosphatase (non-canonical NTP hydrolase)
MSKNIKVISVDQRGWSVRQYQIFSQEEYGASNQDRGFDYALGRTFKELNEVKMASEVIDRGEIPVKVAVREFGLEVADVQMWLLGIANMVGVDTQSALLERYWPVCHKCALKRCICGPKDFRLA